MFIILQKNKKGQNTAEYAILISLVVAGIIAMQTYTQRTLQARMRDASQYLVQQTNELGLAEQYEPYDKVSNYINDYTSSLTKTLDEGVVSMEGDSQTTRREGGFRKSIYGMGDESAMPEGI